MVVSLLLVLNFSIGVSASSGYDRQEADACITISERLSVKGGSGTTEYVDLTDFRRSHILNNHKFGAGKPDKTEFPQSWSDDKILHYVSDVATDPNATWGVGKWNSPYAIGIREGIEIRVDFYPDAHKNYSGMISTAYPLNTLPNPPKGGGY